MLILGPFTLFHLAFERCLQEFSSTAKTWPAGNPCAPKSRAPGSPSFSKSSRIGLQAALAQIGALFLSHFLEMHRVRGADHGRAEACVRFRILMRHFPDSSRSGECRSYSWSAWSARRFWCSVVVCTASSNFVATAGYSLKHMHAHARRTSLPVCHAKLPTA